MFYLVVVGDLGLIGEVLLVISDLRLCQNTNIIKIASFFHTWKRVSELGIVAFNISCSAGDLHHSIILRNHLIKSRLFAISLVCSINNVSDGFSASTTFFGAESRCHSDGGFAHALFPVDWIDVAKPVVVAMLPLGSIISLIDTIVEVAKNRPVAWTTDCDCIKGAIMWFIIYSAIV